MTISTIRRLVKENLKVFLNDYQFILIKGDAGGYTLIHENDAIKLEIVFDCLERPDGKELGSGAMKITFSEVEKTIYNLELTHRLWSTATEPTSPGFTFRNYDTTEGAITRFKKLTSVHISNDEDVAKYCGIVKEYLEEYGLPWFSKYSKIEAVNDFINTLSMQDILNSFSDPFPTQFYRAMVISKMCNNEMKTLEIKEECLRRFKRCEMDSFYTHEMISSYYNSLDDLCKRISL